MHLIEILPKVKEFIKYQENCVTEKPNDIMIHECLKSNPINLEHFVSSAILHFSRIEGIIDENNTSLSDLSISASKFLCIIRMFL